VNINNVDIFAKAGKVYKPIYNISPFTLLDFPDKTACILWFAGCNMSCLYCYNPEIVKGKGRIGYDDTLKFIHSRKNLLDGVVLSGGECTLHHGIPEFLKEIKEMKMKVKVDTNGTNPALIKKLVTDGLIDYIALDFKSPESLFPQITGSKDFRLFEETLDFLIKQKFPFEVRTTVHPMLLSIADINQMIRILDFKEYEGTFYIQNFLNNTETLFELPDAVGKVTLDNLILSDISVVIRNS
jgi:pyruvate formate lyase activating enzyme